MKGSLMVATHRQKMEGQARLSQEKSGRLVSVSILPATVRGACPSLSAPMQTGDGLLVRLRPTTPGLTIAQFRALVEAAEKHGNGLIEITARGNLQLRGMSPQSMGGLAADIDRAGIVPESGIAIETPPLSGLDPFEIADASDIAGRLRRAIDALNPKLLLAAKLAITIDGGGRLTLDGLSADIRLEAIRAADGSTLWALAIAGNAATATPLAILPDAAAIAAVILLLKALADLGPRARGRDLDATALQAQFQFDGTAPDAAGKSPISPIGIISLDETHGVLGLRPSFGQAHTRDLGRFLAVAETAGVSEIRTAPDHAMLLLGLEPDAMKHIQRAAGDCGFRSHADDPANYAIPCSGAGACASAHYATRQVASDLVDIAPELLDGSLQVHLSGCGKGCAHPGQTMLAIVGAPTGYGIVVDGAASSEPLTHIGKEELKSTLAEIGWLVRNNKAAGESTQQCLKRLGRDAIATALRQG